MQVRRTVSEWRMRTRSLELGARTLLMGVVNITPDSFSDGGVSFSREDAIARCLRCLDEGADILDLGAESTRPGSRAGGEDAAVSAEEEQARLLPVIEGVLTARRNAVISADTYKASTAKAALAAGAEIINDVSGFTWDADMPRVCAEAGAGVVLMHTRGRPDEWRGQERLEGDVVLSMVRDGLSESLAIAAREGIRRDAIVLDPGYGFGKRFGENYALLARQAELLPLGFPLLTGVSRKSFLGHTLASLHGGEAAAVDQRENASLAAMVAAILQGASIVRVHSVRAAVEAARIADAVLNAG
jgi:dihydropteroate synthase